MWSTEPEEICGHEVISQLGQREDICQICGMASMNRDDFVRTSCEEQLAEEGRQFHGKQVLDGDSQLAYLSEKSNTIHLVDSEKGVESYEWAECGMGGQLDEAMYVHKSEFGNDYIVRDGEVVGKLCGNCSITASDDKSHFES